MVRDPGIDQFGEFSSARVDSGSICWVDVAAAVQVGEGLRPACDQVVTRKVPERATEGRDQLVSGWQFVRGEANVDSFRSMGIVGNV
ncbi:hypothetical protein ACFWVM_02475 [Nocardia fluminea]|uniref:hypothetical protein n=1 Tax=Nocardia fluminea TaxID=134984 RepID=UPI0036630F49